MSLSRYLVVLLHWYARVAFIIPSASVTPLASAVSVSPTFAVPEIVGWPVAGVLPLTPVRVTVTV